MEDFGSRDWKLPCICGHLKNMHESCDGCTSRFPVQKDFELITEWGRKFCNCNAFKLDNLAFVEQVARAKGLA